MAKGKIFPVTVLSRASGLLCAGLAAMAMNEIAVQNALGKGATVVLHSHILSRDILRCDILGAGSGGEEAEAAKKKGAFQGALLTVRMGQ